MSIQPPSVAPEARTFGAAPEPEQASRRRYHLGIGYLRAFVTLLVLAHHAVLAYHPYAPAPQTDLLAQPRWWPAFPVVDGARWGGWSLFVGANDAFFMSLFFLVSGLFVWKSLQRKGTGAFLRDRGLRLGVPFVVAAALLAPVAYYPAYLQAGGSGVGGFWAQWMSLGSWPSGPAWFIWVLLLFDVILAGYFALRARRGNAQGKTIGLLHRPGLFFVVLCLASAIVYLPLAVSFGAMHWAALGPFTFQTSRILHYFLYFAAGVGLGAYGIDRTFLAEDGKLARRWPVWAGVAGVAVLVGTVLAIVAVSSPETPVFAELIGGVGFVFTCAALGFVFLALFQRFARSRSRVFDSLSDNAYGMYLVHYVFVVWLQYALLAAPLGGFLKGVLVFASTVVLSWGTTALLRRIPAVARVI